MARKSRHDPDRRSSTKERPPDAQDRQKTSDKGSSERKAIREAVDDLDGSGPGRQ